jgi:hypothetical protein
MLHLGADSKFLSHHHLEPSIGMGKQVVVDGGFKAVLRHQAFGFGRRNVR